MSSKTLKNNGAKTESAPKGHKVRNSWLFFLILLNVCLIGFILAARYAKDPGSCLGTDKDRCVVHLILAETKEQQEKGLGGRESLPKNQGMLFKFERSEVQCFWMKDMRFPIDIVWINADKQIIDIKENVMPDTYPESFCSNQLAQFVLEINADKSRDLNLKVNQQLFF